MKTQTKGIEKLYHDLTVECVSNLGKHLYIQGQEAFTTSGDVWKRFCL